MARPKKLTVKMLLRMERVMEDSIERWRLKQDPVLSMSDAVRELVRRGLGEDMLPF